jgi:hypothetical protein
MSRLLRSIVKVLLAEELDGNIDGCGGAAAACLPQNRPRGDSAALPHISQSAWPSIKQHDC